MVGRDVFVANHCKSDLSSFHDGPHGKLRARILHEALFWPWASLQQERHQAWRSNADLHLELHPMLLALRHPMLLARLTANLDGFAT